MAFDAQLDGWLSNVDHQRSGRLEDLSIRRSLLIGGERREVTFHILEDERDLLSACALLNARFGDKGYGSSHTIPSGPGSKTFAAEIDGQIVGTVTLVFDSNGRLASDATFPDELRHLRADGAIRLCELVRLAFVPGLRSRDILAGLFHMVFLYGTMVEQATDLMIEVALRHTAFYREMLGFEAFGPTRLNASVQCQAQLMRLKVDQISSSISRCAGLPGGTDRHSLYHRFFPPSLEYQVRVLIASRYRSAPSCSSLFLGEGEGVPTTREPPPSFKDALPALSARGSSLYCRAA